MRYGDLFLDGVYYHGHQSALKIGSLIDRSRILDSLTEALKDLLTDLLMAHLTSAEAQYDLNLIAFTEETHRVLDLGLEVVGLDTAGKLYLLDLDNVLLLLCFLFSLFLLVAVASVVSDTTYGRLGVGGNEDKVKTLIVCGAKGVVGRHNTDLLTVGSDNSYFFSLNGLVYEQFFCSYNSSPPKNKNNTEESPCRTKSYRTHYGYRKKLLTPARPCGRVRTECSSLLPINYTTPFAFCQ